ncbi:hypothetical protein [Halomonas elongata]|uniref:hypothetical protein n=1 Tax=Halomonas elongata TaxID=2746 RepID=UPI0023AEA441|nr:hypothetical protein [Halomonas elongata]
MMKAQAYYPNFSSLAQDIACAPAPFTPNEVGQRPLPDFVVSKTLEGKTLSIYSDDVWDFRPYRLSGNTGNARFNFKIFSNSTKEEVKWLMFLLLFMVDSGRASGISISTTMTYFKAVRSLAKYCENHGLTIKEVLQAEDELTKFVGKITTRSLLAGLSSVLSHLITLPSEASGYKILSNFKFETVKRRLHSLGEDNQHPVIPNRIYSELIQQLDDFFQDLHEIKDQLQRFIESILACDRYARSSALQTKIGYRTKDFKPFFKEAAQEHGIWEYLVKYKVKNMPSLSTFLTRIQHGARIILHIYTGMRSSESLSLLTNSLKVSNGTYKLLGTTSKFVGQKKGVSWITSQEVERAYEIAGMLAKLVSQKIKLSYHETPLFISTGYLSLFTRVDYDGINIIIGDASSKSHEIYNLLDQDAFRVTKDDLNELEKINPFRAWESEKAFAVGSIWRFTIHQFRRSLSFYVAQSALVSLPSLKRQLKHVSREMTIYYSQSSSQNYDATGQEHIAQLIKREKPEADAIAYISDVLSSGEPLYGAHGTFIDRNKPSSNKQLVFADSREELIKQFKKGEIAYTQTPLGACTTVAPCDQKLLRSMTSCLTCSRSVIKQSKLDRVIARQKLFVDELEDTAPDSVEFRTEKEELRHLLEYKERVMGKAGEQ